uniref:ATP synthase F0 subunit 8 n=1 Tax=Mammuthus primigenius TaxID=37349 RepID=A8DDU5_MAMPR|nr:ATP synthase F0 subunit 8 [Mammuthus primigenius]
MERMDIIIWLLAVVIVLTTLMIFLHLKTLKIIHLLFPVSKELSKKSCVFPWKKKWTKNYPPSSMYP